MDEERDPYHKCGVRVIRCTQHGAVRCYAMLCYICYAMLCYAMLCYAMLCYAKHTVLAMLRGGGFQNGAAWGCIYLRRGSIQQARGGLRRAQESVRAPAVPPPRHRGHAGRIYRGIRGCGIF